MINENWQMKTGERWR